MDVETRVRGAAWRCPLLISVILLNVCITYLLNKFQSIKLFQIAKVTHKRNSLVECTGISPVSLLSGLKLTYHQNKCTVYLYMSLSVTTVRYLNIIEPLKIEKKCCVPIRRYAL